MDFAKYRGDFKFINDSNVYFDNAAASLKPIGVINEVKRYYEEDGGNPHSIDYPSGRRTYNHVESSRQKFADFINADSKDQIVFTTGTTQGLQIIFGGLKKQIAISKKVAMSIYEHASMVLPMYQHEKEIVFYDPLNFDENLFKDVGIVGMMHISNVTGERFDIKSMIQKIRKINKDAIIVVDAAQSMPHQKIDVKDIDCDFLVMTGQKMCGPTASGFMYGKDLTILEPYLLGGGMNVKINMDGTYTAKRPPSSLEAGTINTAGIYGLAKAIDYLNEIGFDNIQKHDYELRQYLINELKSVPNLTLLSEVKEGISCVSFNIKDVHSQDVAYHLGTKGIMVRAGEHCAKLLRTTKGFEHSVRASLYFYNTKAEIDKLVKELKEGGDFLGSII